MAASKDNMIHVQLGAELRDRVRVVKAKDPVFTNDATIVRQALLDFCDGWDAKRAERESGASSRSQGQGKRV